jgi:hypothetical protein
MQAKYRIQNANGTFFGTASDIGSWFTLERAKQLCDHNKGQRIVQICNKTSEILWEVL